MGRVSQLHDRPHAVGATSLMWSTSSHACKLARVSCPRLRFVMQTRAPLVLLPWYFLYHLYYIIEPFTHDVHADARADAFCGAASPDALLNLYLYRAVLAEVFPVCLSQTDSLCRQTASTTASSFACHVSIPSQFASCCYACACSAALPSAAMAINTTTPALARRLHHRPRSTFTARAASGHAASLA